MNHGTYSEALKVGFNPEQAGFMARMSAETRQEAFEQLRDDQAKQKLTRRNAVAVRSFVIAMIILAFGYGLFIGKAFAQ